MKRIILLMLLLLLPVVFAGEGSIEVVSLRAYVDGEPQSLDWEDDTINAKPGDTIQIRLRLENEYEDYLIDEGSIEVDVYGSLELDYTDIERDNEDDDEEDKEIDNDDKKYYILDDFYLPESLDYDFYEFKIWYEYDVYVIKKPYSDNESEANTSSKHSYEHSTTLEVHVREPELPEDDDHEERISFLEMFIDEIVEVIQEHISDILNRLITVEEKIDNMELGSGENGVNYFHYMSFSDRKRMVCNYMQDNDLEEQRTDLGIECTATYRHYKNGKIRQRCKCYN